MLGRTRISFLAFRGPCPTAGRVSSDLLPREVLAWLDSQGLSPIEFLHPLDP